MENKEKNIQTFWKELFQDFRRYGVYIISEKELFTIINNLLVLYDKYKSEPADNQPLERIPEETKSQSGEREEVCSICGGLLDSDSYAYGGKYPVHITCSLNARKIYIGSKDKKGELKPSEYLKDLLSESKKEGETSGYQKGYCGAERQCNRDCNGRV